MTWKKLASKQDVLSFPPSIAQLWFVCLVSSKVTVAGKLIWGFLFIMIDSECLLNKPLFLYNLVLTVT